MDISFRNIWNISHIFYTSDTSCLRRHEVRVPFDAGEAGRGRALGWGHAIQDSSRPDEAELVGSLVRYW